MMGGLHEKHDEGKNITAFQRSLLSGTHWRMQAQMLHL
tara:strand:+ start:9151 stop:9264 length:114 start_codon:yes stop_codon:yes gene_type:complete